jgi:type IV secretory pathway VirJ component
MKKILVFAVVVASLISSLAMASEETVEFGRFGKVTLYRQSALPSHVVIFVSGDGGWNLGVVDMARDLASMDALVAGVDIRHFLKELDYSSDGCSYPAADFEELSKYLQKKLGFPRYVQPVLVGYSSGATLVYAAAVQAPPNTFLGAISMGFCPDLPIKKPFCRGEGLDWTAGPKGKGYSFLPAKAMNTPWIAFQGTIDQVCDAGSVEAYVDQVEGAKVVILPKVGHGFSVPRNWLPQFRKAFGDLTANTPVAGPVSGELNDLPLVELGADGAEKDFMAVVVSGDGGWASIDKDIGEALAKRGVRVVGLNSLQYFWTKKSPEIASKDLGRIIEHYTSLWNKDKVILVGYSLGADVLPFMTGRLPEDIRRKVTEVALLSPSRAVEFEFHLTDWLGGGSDGYPVLPEIEKLNGMGLICFYGEDETDALCRDIPAGLAKVVKLKGKHHFGGDYRPIVDEILSGPEAGNAATP